MKNILLACNAGMSTSLLVQKMQAEAKAQGLDVNISAGPLNNALEKIDTADVLLLGPQISYAKKDAEAAAGSTPVLVTSVDETHRVRQLAFGRVNEGDDLLAVDIYEA